MSSFKKVLFVCYGGGHGKMCLPVAQILEQQLGIETHTFALTMSHSLFSSSGLNWTNYSSYLEPQNLEAIELGKKLALESHNPDSGVPFDESVAYLGLSMQDLINKFGEEKAWELYRKDGRHAFCQNSVLRRVIETIKPSMVVTTNSPRSEKAAVEEANKLGIPTLSICDLFGRLHFHPLESNYVTVLCQETIDNLKKEGVTKSHFFITGNPAFDNIFGHQKIPKIESQNRLGFDPSKKYVLFVDMPAYWDVDKLHLHYRSEQEIIADLDALAAAANYLNFNLIVRPHPSQSRSTYKNWFSKRILHNLILDENYNLHHLLNATNLVISYTSTVLLESLYLGTPIVQINPFFSKSDMPFGDMGLSLQAKNIAGLLMIIKEGLDQKKSKGEIIREAGLIFPMQPAAPKIANLIKEILENSSSNPKQI
jgi:hypothetical protein